MGAYHDVGAAGGQALGNGFGFAIATQARDDIDGDRPIGEAVAEGLEVLLGKQRGWRHDGNLAAAGDG